MTLNRVLQRKLYREAKEDSISERPELYHEPLRFDTIPSRPIRHTCSNTSGPSASRCSLSCTPDPACATRHLSSERARAARRLRAISGIPSVVLVASSGPSRGAYLLPLLDACFARSMAALLACHSASKIAGNAPATGLLAGTFIRERDDMLGLIVRAGRMRRAGRGGFAKLPQPIDAIGLHFTRVLQLSCAGA